MSWNYISTHKTVPSKITYTEDRSLQEPTFCGERNLTHTHACMYAHTCMHTHTCTNTHISDLEPRKQHSSGCLHVSTCVTLNKSLNFSTYIFSYKTREVTDFIRLLVMSDEITLMKICWKLWSYDENVSFHYLKSWVKMQEESFFSLLESNFHINQFRSLWYLMGWAKDLVQRGKTSKINFL